MKFSRLSLTVTALAVATIAGAPSLALAQQDKMGAKDIVLSTLATEAASPQQANAAPAVAAARKPGDALVVSVLVPNKLGMLEPRPANTVFRTGDEFRLKLLSPRDGEILIYNTPPGREMGREPIWKTSIKGGQELVSAQFQLTGNRGDDQLHVVLKPKDPPSDMFAWLTGLFKGTGSGAVTGKDIRLVDESTNSASYFYNPTGQSGAVATILVKHQ